MSRSRDIANFLGLTETANTDNVRLLKFGEGTDSSQVINITRNTIDSNYVSARSGGGVTEVAASGDLPSATDNAGEIYYVTNQNKFYFSNGGSWFANTLVNQDPTISVTPSGTVALSTTQQTQEYIIIGTDSGTLSFSVDSDGNFRGLASGVLTSADDSARFVVTPKTQAAATKTSSLVTFNVSDGVSTQSVSRRMNLSFSTEGQTADGSFVPGWDDSSVVKTQYGFGGTAVAVNYPVHNMKKNKGNPKEFAHFNATANVSSTNYRGGVDVFKYNDLNGQFDRQFLGNTGSTSYYAMGGSIGGDYILVYDTNSAHHCYPYYRSGSTWNRAGIIDVRTRMSVAGITDQNSKFFSGSTSTSYDDQMGDIATDAEGYIWALGSPRNTVNGALAAGGVVIGTRNGSTFGTLDIQQYIPNPFPQANSWFGNSIDISSDGNFLAITDRSFASYSPRTNVLTTGTYIYKKVANSGSSMYQLQTRLRPEITTSALAHASATTNTTYGSIVRLDSDGGTVVIGHPWWYGNPNMYPNHAAAGISTASYASGAIQIYKRDSANAVGENSYDLLQEFWPDSVGYSVQPQGNDAKWSKHFGSSIDITMDGNKILAGQPYDHEFGKVGIAANGITTFGSGTIYSLDSSRYVERNKLHGTITNSYHFGGGSQTFTGNYNMLKGQGRGGALYLDNDIVVTVYGYSAATSGIMRFDSA